MSCHRNLTCGLRSITGIILRRLFLNANQPNFEKPAAHRQARLAFARGRLRLSVLLVAAPVALRLVERLQPGYIVAFLVSSPS